MCVHNHDAASATGVVLETYKKLVNRSVQFAAVTMDTDLAFATVHSSDMQYAQVGSANYTGTV